ncbi:MAG: murein transglycosylase A [Rhodospirillaceae bacterium]|nr:murein transglycosylase A [Rhodospirillaceae bacterium]MBT5565036.1 murein transglycosylase A [Rhodospirillaceae bacterium]MBT6090200.1 murein transglycosylase A [Rhodospirillaceae bacterium]MBT6961726.1 murein transglycosylase A [Rhodospirillaceae bacterium]MBT7451224.1 murein transglycosylase A [Rhodospirillaceae bacterium]
MSNDRISRILKSQATAYAVASFVGFSVGLLVAAQFFPTRVERVEVIRTVPAPVPKPVPSVEPKTQPLVTYTRVNVEDLPGWTEDSVSSALPALQNACRAFDGRPETDSVGRNGIGGTVGDWRAPCAALALIASNDDGGLRAVMRDLFVPYAVSSPQGPDGKFTGYYEASLRGSESQSEKYSVPLYALPNDLVELDARAFDLSSDIPSVIGQVTDRRLVPYEVRRTIEQDTTFSDRADVLVWVDDPVDAHLLHIQGSGRVRMPDGSERRIGYAGNNGRRFRGIGGILLSAGVLGPGQGSMPSVADWLRDNPAPAQSYMEDNPRFIFFRWNDGPGPLGALGVPLEPMRSLAVDPKYIPYGAPLWLDVDDPDGQSLDGMVVALDTGSAIRGAVRGDFFWGSGDAAFAKAGRMNSRGRYYLFLPRSVAQPSQIGEKPL